MFEEQEQFLLVRREAERKTAEFKDPTIKCPLEQEHVRIEHST